MMIGQRFWLLLAAVLVFATKTPDSLAVAKTVTPAQRLLVDLPPQLQTKQITGLPAVTLADWPTDNAKPGRLAQAPGIQIQQQQQIPAQIQQRLRQIFQIPGPAPIKAPGANPNEPAGNGDTRARDAVDARAPYDRRIAGLLEQAAKRAKNKDWDTAFDAIRAALDRPPALVRDANGEYRATSIAANQILGSMPPEALQLYELRYGVPARQLLEKAEALGDPAILSLVATRYFHTTAGYRAADRLASYFLDRGDFVVAAHWFKKLQDANADMTRLPAWQLKHTLASRITGRKSEMNDVDDEIRLGGSEIDVKQWIEDSLALGLTASEPESLKDWPQMNGNAARRAVATGGDPLLLKRWTIPSTGSAVLLPDLAQLIQAIEDTNKVVIPSTVPIAVDGRLIFRSLRGISVVDADTGKRLWESPAGISAEQIFLGRRAGRSGGLMSTVSGTFNNGQRVANYDQGEVPSLLFRDGVWGLVSSDGQRVFTLEDHAIASANLSSYRFSGRAPSDRYQRDWTSNRLVAYDIHLGRAAWQVGGSELGETFDLPLAGTSFLGVPLVDSDEALVIGERDAEVRLHALDVETGQPKWSALLGYSETPIDRDPVRRNWAAQVAIEDGVIVCPTTLGWLIAIDRTSHSILWANRFANVQPEPVRRSFGTRTSVNQPKGLNERWGPSTPIVVDGKVLVTPPEAPLLCCFDLADGEKIWQIEKQGYLYIAAVHDENVIVIGNGIISAFALKDGKQQWTQKMEMPVVGIGVPVADRYYVPMQDGHIAAYSLIDGFVIERFRPDADSVRLGNLLMHGGQVFSQSTLGVTAFEQRNAFVSEVADRRKKTPDDPWARLQSARIRLTEGKAREAAELLKDIHPESLKPQDQIELQLVRKQALATVVRSDRKNAAAAIDQLAALADTPEAQLQVVQMKFENELRWGLPSAAIEHLFEMMNRDTGQSIELQHLQGQIKLSAWLAGRFRELNARLSESEREALNLRIGELAQAAGDGSPEDQKRFLSVFRDHSESTAVAQQLAAHLIDQNDLVAAETILTQLSESEQSSIAARAQLRLATLLEHHGQSIDALSIYQQLSESKEAIPVDPNGEESINQIAMAAAERLSKQAVATDRQWGQDWRISRMGSNYSSRVRSRDLMPKLADLQFLDEHRIEYDQGAGRFNFISQNDETVWSVPFHRYQMNQPVTVEVVGHRVYVLHAEIMQCLSPVERRIIWTRRFSDSMPTYRTTYYGPASFGVNRQGAFLVGQTQSQRRARSMLAVINSDYAVIRGRNSIEVLDSDTGATRFKLSRPGASTLLYGTKDAIVLLGQDVAPLVLSSADATVIEASLPDQLSNMIVDQTDSGLITLDGRATLFGLMGSTTVVKKLDPIRPKDKQVVWSTKLGGKNWYSQIDSRTLAALSDSGKLRLVDLESGHLTDLGSPIPKEPLALTSAIIMRDKDRLYVLTTNNSNMIHSGANVPSAFVNGHIVAVNRTDGRRLWSMKADNASVILEHMRHSPLLVMTTRRLDKKQSRYVSAVIAVDKGSGNIVAKSSGSSSDSYQSLRLSNEGRYVELRSYNHRLRVIAEPSKPSGPLVE